MSGLSVVIVTFNSAGYIGPCLRSLFADRLDASPEVIVVDNASEDGGAERVRREFPQARLIVNESNLGFAAACNIGARASRSEYILFMNPDTLLPPGTLGSALAFMASRLEAGLAGFRTRDAAGRFQRTAFGFPSPVRMFAYVSGLNRVFKLTRFGRGSRLLSPDYIQGSFLLARRAAFEAVGGFDEAFFMYSEDVDLCLRIRRAGWSVYYVPEPAIVHYGGGSVSDPVLMLDRFIRSLFALYGKHRTRPQIERLRRAVRRGLRLRGALGAAADLIKLKKPSTARMEANRRLRRLVEADPRGGGRPNGPMTVPAAPASGERRASRPERAGALDRGGNSLRTASPMTERRRSAPHWRLRRAAGLATPILALAAALFFGTPPTRSGNIPGRASLNPEFLDWIQASRADRAAVRIDGGRTGGEIPPPIERTVRERTALPGSDPLPAAFDLRSQARVSPVRDQGDGAGGWAYAALGSLESNLMPDRPRDFSERNLIARHGFVERLGEAGNAWMAAACLARWGGPRDETVRTDVRSAVLAGGPAQQVGDILFLPPRTDALDNAAVKMAVLSWGGVYASMAYAPAHYESSRAAYHSQSRFLPNHGILVVGWDDDFDRRCFSAPPPGDGAFLCKNSRGPDWGFAGFFYVSYYDASFTPRAVFTAGRTRAHSRVYQHDRLGWVTDWGYRSSAAWGANVFTAESGDPLSAVGLVATAPGAAYEVSVYTDAGAVKPGDGRLRASVSGSLPAAGYFIIPLDSPVRLSEGEPFSIVVRFETPGYDFPLPVEEALPGYSDGASALPRQSFWSPDGASWSDAGRDAGCNLCIKGYARAEVEPPIVTGTVRTPGGDALEGVTLTGLPDNPATGPSGAFARRVPACWSGSITPMKPGYVFSPASRDYADLRANALDQDFTAAPDGRAYEVFPAVITIPREGGPRTVSIEAAAGGGWSASSADPWLSITSGQDGSGHGFVRLETAPNPGPRGRSGRLIAAGRTVLVNQRGESASHGPSDRLVLPECVWAEAVGGGVWESEVRITDVSGGSLVSVVLDAGGVRHGPIALWNNMDGPMTSVTFANLPETLAAAEPDYSYRGRLGALEIFTQDADHLIHVVSRIVNGPGSHTLPGIVPEAGNIATPGRPMIILDLRNDADHRAACGFYNPTAEPVSAEFTLRDGGGAVIGRPFTQRVRPFGNQAFSPFTEAGLPYPPHAWGGANLTFAVTSGAGGLAAFGSTIDNVSHDSAAHPVLPTGGDSAGSPGPVMILPECIWSDAFVEGNWITEVLITDMTGGSVVSARFHPGGGVRRGPVRVLSNAGGPAGATRRFDNFLFDLSEADPSFDYYGSVGAVEFVTQDDAHAIHVSARIRNGRFSKMLSALRPVAANAAALSRPMIVPGLRRGPDLRSMFGAFNFTGEPVRAEFRLMGDLGGTVGAPFVRTFEGRDFLWFDPFAETGVPRPGRSSDSAALIVRPVSGAGELICFGAVVRGIPGDPSALLAVPLR